MNIRIDIECTPEEARTFLGLPDIKPMQDAVVDHMRQQMESSIPSMDPETVLKTWMPMSLQGLEQMNRAMWEAMSTAARSGDSASASSSTEPSEEGGSKTKRSTSRQSTGDQAGTRRKSGSGQRG